MTLALVRKELRDQRPFVAFGIFLCVVDLVELVFFVLPDQRPLWLVWTRELTNGGYGAIMLLVALGMAWGLLVREHDERTLEFLDGLPVSRPAQFLTKIGTAVAVLMIYPVFFVGVALVEHLLSRNSLDRSLHLQPLAMQLTMLAIAFAVALSVGLVLSFLRRLGWLVLAALVVGHYALEARSPWIRNFSPLQLLIPEYRGMHWKWPTQLLRVQLPVLAVCLVTAGLLYNGRFEDWLRWVARALSTRMAKIGMVVMAIGLFMVFGLVAGKEIAGKQRSGETDEEEGWSTKQSVTFPATKPISSETRHYVFSYLSSASARAAPLLDRADRVFETVQMFFHAPPGDRISADLTGSTTNTAGTAFWNTVRMKLDDEASVKDPVAVLGHETTHVFIQRIARMNESKVPMLIWPLDEGLATYVEYRFFQPASALEQEDRLIAALRTRRELEVDELIFSDRLLRNRGREMAYPMGRLFIDALIRRYGEDAPARIFTEAGKRDLPANLAHADLWNELFQANGYDLALVVDDFYAAADRLVRTHRASIERLPRPRGAVEVRSKWIWLTPSLDGTLPPGWSLVCRIRPSVDSTHDRYKEAHRYNDKFAWPSSSVSGQRIWYQLGVSDGSGPVLYEPWASAPLD